ncbi:hypothetical protein E0H22_02515 [Rhodopseudomonas boonkerdii]|jgi:hypothetical protein|uniref:hypothetical protein n=1 Tax=Nitrobacteraceae TaxID=41294 RepID=UPI000927E19D|nr:hypothetical protein [Rhodopseudomonas boonkerdii]MBN9584294.1 hypothetical protein [Afipia sp.]OJU18468.1 MAG: hypothetical protein BGN84_17880 [Afipia sp. 62-7]OYU88985.1 MAG: hypothetical protein CFE29_15690 [Bradyrhizobiaceae bacterium PARB1]UGV24653.1 hypothetical protein E0H22_02515 [Rhodopseudomonas boonkerdii]
MDIRRTIGRLLAVFVIAGLAFAPMVTPATAKGAASAVTVDMSAMSADMPCCPDEQKSDGCKDCPLLALCMLTVAQADLSAANGIRISFQVGRLSFAFDDLAADGLVGDPPDHPPRTST